MRKPCQKKASPAQSRGPLYETIDQNYGQKNIKKQRAYGYIREKKTKIINILNLLKMKKLRKITLVATLLAVTISCHKDDEPAPKVITCGCDATNTIQTVSNQVGILKKNSGNNYIDFITTQYYIQIGNPPSITTYYSICDNSSLINITVAENESKNVIFSGSTKEFCAPSGIILIDTPFNIKLTQIQTQ